MGQQIITISPDGTMSGLQVKPGKGVDLTKFGPAAVVRASEIVWDENAQAWKIDVLQEVGKGVVTARLFIMASPVKLVSKIVAALDALAPSGWQTAGEDQDGALLFSSYDDAVRVEIAYLDALRVKGQF